MLTDAVPLYIFPSVVEKIEVGLKMKSKRVLEDKGFSTNKL
jgi:hypothetical protein